jgi:hypothetical protein
MLKTNLEKALKKIVSRHYTIPKIPDDLKHGKTLREKQYLKIIDDLLTYQKRSHDRSYPQRAF